MHRTSVFVSILAVLALLLPAAGATAQDASPAASPVAGQPLDLAAMVLLPSDFNESGFGAGLGAFIGVEFQAEAAATEAGLALKDILDPLRSAGFLRRYSLPLEQRVPEGAITPEGFPDPVEKRVLTSITEYASAEGAAAGFDLLEQQAEDRTDARDTPLTRSYGDESELTRGSYVTSDTNAPYQSLNLTFRLGNLIADVIIQDLSNQQPEAAEAEALAEALQDRIEAVLTGGAPGLSNLVIRPEGTRDADSYLVLNDTPIPGYLETDEEVQAWTTSYAATTGVSDVYSLQQPLGEFPYLAVWLSQFPTPEAAEAWLTERPTERMASPDSGYIEVEEVRDAGAVGERSRVFAYGFQVDEQTTSRGYAVFTRVGPIVARVQVDSVPEAPVAAVLELAEAQVRCLEAERCLEPILVPAAFSAPQTAPQASPAATPAA